MSDRGFNLADQIGSLDSTTLQDHAVLLAYFTEEDERGFSVRISPILEADTETAFRAIRIYSGVYPGNGELLARFEVSDAEIDILGTVTIESVDYLNTVQYFWAMAEDEVDPLEGVDTFSIAFERFTVEETGTEFEGIIQFPHLDLGAIGREKQMIGLDLISDAPEGVSMSIGYDQRNLAARTAPYTVPADTVPGQLIPMPVSGPSFDLKLVFSPRQQWEFQAATLYLQDWRPTS